MASKEQITAEAHRLARHKLKDMLRNRGVKISHVSARDISQAAMQLYHEDAMRFRAQAEAHLNPDK